MLQNFDTPTPASTVSDGNIILILYPPICLIGDKEIKTEIEKRKNKKESEKFFSLIWVGNLFTLKKNPYKIKGIEII